MDAIREGHFDQAPETVHEKAYQLLRLLAANHPFVDGNKRTALMSVRVFYALNELEFDYDRRIKEVLKELATDETAVEIRHRDVVLPGLAVGIDADDGLPSGIEVGGTDGEPNDHDDSTRNER